MKCIWAIVVSVVLTSTVCAAILGTACIQDYSNNFSEQAHLWGGGLGGGIYYTGVYTWTRTAGSGLGEYIPNWGFCVELVQGPHDGQVNIVSLEDAPLPALYGTPMGPAKADFIRELWGRNFNPVWAVGLDRQKAEAFNAAIWEIIYETDSLWDVNCGTGFRAADIQEAALANTWLAQLNGDSAYFAPDLVATSTLCGQDYLVQIPEPVTMTLLAAGTIAVFRKRK